MLASFFQSLRGRILLVALAPCLAFAVVAGLAISGRMTERAHMVAVENLLGLAGQGAKEAIPALERLRDDASAEVRKQAEAASERSKNDPASGQESRHN